MHVKRFLLLIGATALCLATLAPAVSASPRSGDLAVAKSCATYAGAAGDFCTITSSRLNAIKVGSRVYYLQAADFGTLTLSSDIIIDGPGSNTAYGHVTLDLATGLGTVTISGWQRVARQRRRLAPRRGRLRLGGDLQLQSGWLSSDRLGQTASGRPPRACLSAGGPA